jgi:hypothetical protein
MRFKRNSGSFHQGKEGGKPADKGEYKTGLDKELVPFLSYFPLPAVFYFKWVHLIPYTIRN